MIDALRALVEAESPSADPAACRACVDVADSLARELFGVAGERIEAGGRVHLRWRFGAQPRVLLIGHLDTVWPLGTLARWPFDVTGGRATGPGVFDMKAGVVQLLFALARLERRDGVAVLLTTDEEIGSPTARPVIEETAQGIEWALVLEPSADGALKTERKGVAVYRIGVTGRAAHAGLEPEKGANAAVELAHLLLAVAELALPEEGTTVTPTLVTAGTAMNTVPAHALAHVDVRTRTVAEAERIDAAINGLRAVTDGTALEIERTVGVPPLEHRASAALYGRAQRVAERLGLPPLAETAVGGGSDGNLLAGLGVEVLDGLGAVGANAHAEGEYVEVAALADRCALVAGLVADLLGSSAAPTSPQGIWPDTRSALDADTGGLAKE
ncbi:MAG TPA: M20/M25/M40 family metallo-hydrolase [Gaiellaceae bacterium]|nr:M20/M25/M40 family metallo-hydrolase [Gaiellaceae bacterium]